MLFRNFISCVIATFLMCLRQDGSAKKLNCAAIIRRQHLSSVHRHPDYINGSRLLIPTLFLEIELLWQVSTDAFAGKLFFQIAAASVPLFQFLTRIKTCCDHGLRRQFVALLSRGIAMKLIKQAQIDLYTEQADRLRKNGTLKIRRSRPRSRATKRCSEICF